MVQYGNAGRYSEAAEEKESQTESRAEVAQNQPAVREKIKPVRVLSRSFQIDTQSGRRAQKARKPESADWQRKKAPSALRAGGGKGYLSR